MNLGFHRWHSDILLRHPDCNQQVTLEENLLKEHPDRATLVTGQLLEVVPPSAPITSASDLFTDGNPLTWRLLIHLNSFWTLSY